MEPLQLQINGTEIPIHTLFAPRPEAAFKSNPLCCARHPFSGNQTVTLRRAGNWEKSRLLTLDGGTVLEKDGDTLRFQPAAAGTYSIYDEDLHVIHLFLENPPKDALPPGYIDASLHGITSNANHLQTVAIQGLLDRIAANGGGTIHFPAGIYRTGSLFASGDTRLHLDRDCIIQGSHNPADYLTHEKAFAQGTIKRVNTVGRAALITFSDGSGGGLSGGGTLDGAGHRLREQLVTGKEKRLWFNLVSAIDCVAFTIQDCHLRDSEFWSTHFYRCENVRVSRVALINELPHRDWNPHIKDIFWNNADGINSDTCHYVRIEDCFIHTGDDCLTLKLTDPEGDNEAELTDIVMHRCTLRSSTSAMKIGTETRGRTVGEVRFENMLVLPDHTGSVATLSVFDVARIKNVIYQNIHSEARCRFIDVTVRPRRDGQIHFGSIENLVFRNIRLVMAGPCILRGQSAEHAIRGVLFRNVRINGKPLEKLSDLNLADTPHVEMPGFSPA